MISQLRLWSRTLLPSLPVVGQHFRAYFQRSGARYLRRVEIAQTQDRRQIAKDWRRRIADVCSCPDNADIPCVPDAGQCTGNDIIMHNGIRIAYGTYGTYDTQHVMRMLQQNRGIHEPQEEKVFQQVLPLMPDGAVMLELGAFWGFYSLWFIQAVVGARCILVEPEWANLNSGRLNMALNRATATFIRAFVGESSRRQRTKPPTVSVDQLLDEYQLEKIHLLHSDIQGCELEMLRGAARTFLSDRVDFVFLSTHSNEIHAQCRDWLRRHSWNVIADANLDESYSVDGLLVAHRPGIVVKGFQPISHRGR